MNRSKELRLRPMLATNSDYFNDQDYLYEIKWDGFRCISYLFKDKTILYSRNGQILNQKFPQLVNLHQYQSPMIIDGEIVLFHNGKPNFSLLQKCFRYERPLEQNYAISLIVFDILFYDKQSLLNIPLIERKKVLHTKIPESSVMKLSYYNKGNGDSLFQLAKENELEGVMAKHEQSHYLPGVRSKLWKKIKFRKQDKFIIIGFIHNNKRVISLAIASSDSLGTESQLFYRGLVGSGFSESQRYDMFNLLLALRSERYPVSSLPKLQNFLFIEPLLTCVVGFLEYTSDGRLRHPLFISFEGK